MNLSASFAVRIHATASPRYSGLRCKHNPEPGAFQSPVNMPEVRACHLIAPVKFTAELQRLAFNLALYANPTLTYERWAAVYSGGRAFCNGHGIEGDDPKLMDGIICAGMFLHAIEDGNQIICVPGLHAIDPHGILPSVSEIIERNWYFEAVNWNGTRVTRFPQGMGLPVLVPYVLEETAKYPTSWFAPWNETFLPDALKVYL